MRNVSFVGSKHLGLQVLKEIYSIAASHLQSIITFDDTADTRSELSEYKRFSEETGKPLCVLTKPSQLPECVDTFRPDMIIVAGWYWMLKGCLLESVQDGVLGIHASLLPKNRGSAPLVWSIINNDQESGVTLFYFDEDMDTGDIVAQKRFKIEEDDDIAHVLNKAEKLTVEIVRESYPALLDGTASRVKQDHRDATFCSHRNPQDGRIDWKSTSRAVYNAIRAQTHPYPGAFCYTEDGKKLSVWKASVFPQPYHGIPGLVAQVSDDHVVVTCGDGAIRIHSVQVDSQEEAGAAQVLRYGDRLT